MNNNKRSNLNDKQEYSISKKLHTRDFNSAINSITASVPVNQKANKQNHLKVKDNKTEDLLST